MSLKNSWSCLLLAVAALSSPLAVRADVVPISSTAQIDNASVINFDSMSLGWITDPSVLAGQGIIFDGTFGLSVVPGSLVGMGPGKSLVDLDGQVEIDLVNPVDAVGLDFTHLPFSPKIILKAYGQNGFLGSISSSGNAGYLGLAAPGEQITSIVLQSPLGGLFPHSHVNIGFAFDNLAFGMSTSAVPAPAGLLLGLIGLGSVGLVRRRIR